MAVWKDVRDRILADHPRMRLEYEKLGPRFALIGELIDARERLGVSQSELARRMGVKPNVISRLESAQHSPRLDTLIAYTHALGLEFRTALVKPRGTARAATPLRTIEERGGATRQRRRHDRPGGNRRRAS